jgi:hypothetical protein
VKLTFDISPEEAAAVREFYEKWEGSPLVQLRRIRNLEGRREPITETLVWDAMVSCLLTTQQRSGPQSPITRFIRTRPFPLSLAAARSQKNVDSWVVATLSAWRGIRRYNDLARDIGFNFVMLEDGRWPELMTTLRTLERPHAKMDERRAAHAIDALLAGFGPKQARNLLQALGLTQHETPLDSRVAKWLKAFEFPAPVSAAALGDAGFYDFALDGFQQVAAAANIVPCLLDAAIFASFDPVWSEEEVVY